jgi:DNA-binding NtrC family response regulator
MSNRINALDQTVKRQVREGERLKSLLDRYGPEEAGLIGSGRAMERIRETARIVAPSNATVLIEGQTGSGKEVLARHIHSLSPRKEGPFVKVDCSTIPRNLMESQLFGHEKGAFTGAFTQAKGLFEQADQGTIFLDEIGNLSPETQAKLLQFLNDFTITRVGGTGPIRLDVRCIAATNIPLAGLTAAGLFREDLYYRINAVLLTVPPLSSRREDIPALAAHFLEQASKELGKLVTGFSRPALKRLADHSFQGNVRELKNAVHRAAIFCQGETITPEDIQFVAGTGEGGKKRKELPAFHLYRTDPERVRAVIRENHGRLARAAREMGVTRTALYQYVRSRKIDVNQYRKGF